VYLSPQKRKICFRMWSHR